MKVVVCGSMTLAQKMVEAERELNQRGHEVVLPEHTHHYAPLDSDDHRHNESAQNKIKEDLIRKYYHKIEQGDAVLIVNETKKGIDNYIGCNSLLELSFAYVLRKRMYLLNPLPDITYINDELKAMEPEIVVIHGNYDLIK